MSMDGQMDKASPVPLTSFAEAITIHGGDMFSVTELSFIGSRHNMYKSLKSLLGSLTF